jgi:signal peptidase I
MSDSSTQASSSAGDEQKSGSTLRSLVQTLATVAAVVLFAFGFQALIIKPYRIPTGSMEPTLQIGQRVLVNRIGMRLEGPHIGEIAVFHPPQGADEETSEGEPKCGTNGRPVVEGKAACSKPVPQEASVTFIKRIVAGPGDTIFIKSGHVYRNGVREHDPYIAPCEEEEGCDFPTPIKIPPGHWFMMGDNRGNSDDSRYWGPVPTNWIIGGAFATYWPPDRIGLL